MNIRALHFKLVLEVILQERFFSLDVIQLSLLPLLCVYGAIQIL